MVIKFCLLRSHLSIEIFKRLLFQIVGNSYVIMNEHTQTSYFHDESLMYSAVISLLLSCRSQEKKINVCNNIDRERKPLKLESWNI